MSKWIDNKDADLAAGPEKEKPPPTKTIFLAQVGWREPNDDHRYPYAHIDYCKTIKADSPEELREAIATQRFLRGSCERFRVDAWEESLKYTDGHWKLDEKHGLAVRGETDAR